jgi:hypothetical protein
MTTEQVKVLLKGYCQGLLDRSAIEEVLAIGKSRFFALLNEYRRDPDGFSITYERQSRPRLSVRVEAEIEKELMLEKSLIDDSTLPITRYNYAAIRDRLIKHDIRVSSPTIIARARKLGCYQPHPRKKVHDREVITTAIGALIQHDGSHHRWSPYARDKWVLITSLDDFKGRDSVWRRHVLQTDEADPQWRQVMRVLGVDVAYALSPAAKGKVERPYRWLQDRIVRTCAIEKLTTIEEARAVLKEGIDRYNNHQVHSTTGEVPSIRFEKAKKEGSSLFRPFTLPEPYASTKDIFCLGETRMVNGYRKTSLSNHEIVVPNVPPQEEVEVHLIPDMARGALEVRIW